ncbi:MAG: flippase, partial [Gemmatimonadota bacterium]|nr:flippase [Gemmatimonadota bacterium]
VGLIFNAVAFVPTTFIAAFGRPDLSAKFHLLELPIHIPLAWWLVAQYGIAGAATAWSMRVALDAGLLFGAADRLLRGGGSSLKATRQDLLAI